MYPHTFIAHEIITNAHNQNFFVHGFIFSCLRLFYLKLTFSYEKTFPQSDRLKTLKKGVNKLTHYYNIKA